MSQKVLPFVTYLLFCYHKRYPPYKRLSYNGKLLPMQHAPSNVIGYCSLDNDTELSLENQRKIIEEMVHRYGHNLKAIYEDNFVDNPKESLGLDRLLNEIQEGDYIMIVDMKNLS